MPALFCESVDLPLPEGQYTRTNEAGGGGGWGVGGDTSCIWTHYLTIFLMHATHLCAETHTFALVAVTLSGVISRQVQPCDGFGLDCANRSVWCTAIQIYRQKDGRQRQTEGSAQLLKTVQRIAHCLTVWFSLVGSPGFSRICLVGIYVSEIKPIHGAWLLSVRRPSI